MAAPPAEEVVRVIREAAVFTGRMGFAKEADALQAFAVRFETEKPTYKVLRSEVRDAKDNASRQIRENRFYDADRRVKPEMLAEHEEYVRIWIAFQNLLYPQESTTKLKGLVPGSDRETSVLGDPSAAPLIAERSLDVARQFSEAVIEGELQAAYSLFAAELQASTSLARFSKQLPLVDGEHEGMPLEYAAQGIPWIYADAPSRNKSNKDGEWPRDTPKANKRAMVGGWWTSRREGDKAFGRSVFFWITEEPQGYRIAKFQQFYQ